MRVLKRKKQDRKPLVQSVKGSKQEGWRHVKRCPASPLSALSWTEHHCQQKVAEFWLLGAGIFPQSFLWRKLDSCTSYLSFLVQVHKCFAKFHTNETTPLSSRWRKLHDKEKRFKEYETIDSFFFYVKRFFIRMYVGRWYDIKSPYIKLGFILLLRYRGACKGGKSPKLGWDWDPAWSSFDNKRWPLQGNGWIWEAQFLLFNPY